MMKLNGLVVLVFSILTFRLLKIKPDFRNDFFIPKRTARVVSDHVTVHGTYSVPPIRPRSPIVS